MKLIANIIIPTITIVVIIYGIYKKTDIYNSFLEGVNEGLKLSLDIFPTIMAMVIAINLLINSNIIIDITSSLKNFFSYINFPSEILPIALLRPISSSASLIVMNDVLLTYGADSYLGIIASIIQGSTDTTIYILGMYFSSVGIKKIRYSLLVGLLADLFTVIAAICIVNMIF